MILLYVVQIARPDFGVQIARPSAGTNSASRMAYLLRCGSGGSGGGRQAARGSCVYYDIVV